MEKIKWRRDRRIFHHLVFRVLRVLARPVILWLTAFHAGSDRLVSAPGLIYCNHNCDIDAVLVGMGLRKHMYFVSSAHIIHKKWGPLIRLLFDPVLRFKGRADTSATLDILRRLRAGDNVCIFIEGERSYDGLTGAIPDSGAHLAKLAGVPLHTYRLRGGYFTHPRWSAGLRKGWMAGELAASYTPEQIKEISQEELQRMIERDLFVDAYADQERSPRAYRGKRLAEHLETALFICPVCGGMGTLHSAEDRLHCACGLGLRYTQYGYLESLDATKAPYATVRDWYCWQKEQVAGICALALANQQLAQPLAADEDQCFYIYNEGRQRELSLRCRLALYVDHLQLPDAAGGQESVPLDQVVSFSCHQQMQLGLILKDGRFYEILSPHPRSAVKYQLFFNCLKANPA
ncbi:MAG: 1-acyl-sn-glycerol-3-phosphate acyltransferase [Clostridia bacterium]|nr:1-acyl-sn-glycerol-3-phosphate acyltransferase [Clostridia bacterium]